jgi:hypothetical protein
MSALCAIGFTQAELQALVAFRTRDRQAGDRFSARELGYLRFLRWLHQTGRLAV